MKGYLKQTRYEFGEEGIFPYCPICGHAIKSLAVDMHEAILTRGDIARNKDLQLHIFVKENCVLVHHGSCHNEASTQDGKAKCIRQLIEMEGAKKIYIWLNFMKERMKNDTLINEALHQVEKLEAEHEVQSMW